MCVCMCACVCVHACVHARGWTHVPSITHVFAGVYQWKKPGRRVGRECENEILEILRIFILYLLLF